MLYTCDLICYGAAAPGVFQAFLAMLERHAGRCVVSYAHRGAGMGPHGDEIAMFDDGTVESGETDTLVWRRIWYGYLCRESCFRCGHHSLRRPGDLTIGDWWGLGRYAPALEDPWGVSCIIANSGDGVSLLSGARDALDLAVTPVAEVANPSQPMLLHPPARGAREAFWRALYEEGFEGACRRVGSLGVLRAAKDLIRRVVAQGGRQDAATSGALETAGGWDNMAEVDFGRLEEEGEYPVAFAARNRDDDVRRMSSSGGVFHALASHVIEDLGGVVYGCAFDEGLRARHIRCETMAEAERCMGSKYSQSDMGDAISRVREDLAAGRTVLFTGTPCQVAAVRSACGNVSGGGSLILADIICHGVPSPAIFQEWLRVLEDMKGEAVARYEHRPKSAGWGHFERVTWANDSSEQGTRWSETWKAYFYDNRSLRTSCYRCPYAVITGRPGDVTIADFWGIERTSLAGVEDRLGVSLVLANTAVGLGLLPRLNVDLWESSIADALPRNPMLERPSTYEGDRDEVWRDVYAYGLLTAMRRHGFLKPLWRAAASRCKRAINRLLGR